MTTDPKGKTLGQAIDDIIAALQGLDEASRPVAIRAACEQFKIAFGAGSLAETSHLPGERAEARSASGGLESGASLAQDIRSLKERKQPATAQEMACVVAYYLQSVAPQNERKAAIDRADLDKYFRQADYPLPSRLQQLLVDTRAAGYFDSAARGTYRLNAVGHNLVVHTLPRQASAAGAAAQIVRSPSRTRRKPKSRRLRGK